VDNDNASKDSKNRTGRKDKSGVERSGKGYETTITPQLKSRKDETLRVPAMKDWYYESKEKKER
jgi:hypothetical protein